ncbi:MAG: hypothetical protein IPJ20_16940 [Flammeovirgaceae bacterium]|nr:hypothetical protein [Flammeovirgaceae bacterium]
MKYPINIAGCYVLSIDSLSLRPKFPPSVSDDIKIDLIWFDEGIANLIFENGYVQLLPTQYDKQENIYVLNYDGIKHGFQVMANLEGISMHVDMKVLIDFNKFLEEQ